jgi:hypothetical protein
MNNSLKGALLSGLAFPGVGQIFLKHYKRGIALIITTSVSLLVFVVKAMQHALTILENTIAQGGEINMRAISSAAAQASTTSESLLFKLLWLLMLFCWIIGVVDAYRIGKRKDIEERMTTG